ncbi:hypothetical protein [Candidatus Lokiarchaeum ossiferum]|uniref:hypothetical protein n=1 Tax=Candidatus Lokiarchaeum ossiferum TaxID=2951803 RepID=UPI00352F1B9C
MPFTIQSTDIDWKKVYAIHYKSIRYLKILPVMGLLGLGIALINLIFLKKNLEGIFCSVIGLYLLFIKQIYIGTWVRAAKTNKNFGASEEIEFLADGCIIAQTNDLKTEISIKNILHYLIYKDWILLYIQKNAFIFFKISELNQAGVYNELKSFLLDFDIQQKFI